MKDFILGVLFIAAFPVIMWIMALCILELGICHHCKRFCAPWDDMCYRCRDEFWEKQ
jgi:hypothetical protein